MSDNFSSLRREYRHVALDEADVHSDPVVQFGRWFQEAVDAGLEMPNSMVLATADISGRPTARYVLMKGFDAEGFVFYSHSVSVKGRQLAENPRAALVFYWEALHRQVRVEGTVTPLGAAAADEYFATRPYASRISVWVAEQSSIVPGREFMEQRYDEFAQRFPDDNVPRPDTWIGYRVRPESVEFWQGRESRLHDRLLFQRDDREGWRMQRLAP